MRDHRHRSVDRIGRNPTSGPRDSRQQSAMRSPGGGHFTAGGTAAGLRRGAMLLEVLVAFALLLFGMAVVGLQVNAGLDAARSAEIGTRACMLTDTILAELQAGVIQPDLNDTEISGDFGPQAPGYTWRILIDNTDIDDLYMITLQIGRNEARIGEQIDDPTREIRFDDPGTRIVRTVYRLVPRPADVNVERDFGISREEIEGLTGAVGQAGGEMPDGGERPRGGDGGGDGPLVPGNLQDLLRMAEQFGLDSFLLDFLLDPAGFDPRILSQLPEEQFLQLTTILDLLFSAGGSDLGALTDQLTGGGDLAALLDRDGPEEEDLFAEATGGEGRGLDLSDRPRRPGGDRPGGRDRAGRRGDRADEESLADRGPARDRDRPDRLGRGDDREPDRRPAGRGRGPDRSRDDRDGNVGRDRDERGPDVGRERDRGPGRSGRDAAGRGRDRDRDEGRDRRGDRRPPDDGRQDDDGVSRNRGGGRRSPS